MLYFNAKKARRKLAVQLFANAQEMFLLRRLAKRHLRNIFLKLAFSQILRAIFSFAKRTNLRVEMKFLQAFQAMRTGTDTALHFWINFPVTDKVNVL